MNWECQNWLTACFTGPRPKNLFGYDDDEAYKYLLAVTKEVVDLFYYYGYRYFISGGAQGFDQIAFWAVNEMKRLYPDIYNIVYIPYKEQPDRWQEKGMFGKKYYRKLLWHADHTEIIGSDMNPLHSIKCRNVAMVDASNAVIGCFKRNYDYHISGGGTAFTLRYAEQIGKPLYLIDLKTGTYS